MDFTLPEDIQLLKKIVHDFVQREVEKVAMEIEENEQVISQFLGDNSQFSKVCAPLDDRFRTSERFARTFPNRDNMDGFFLAVLDGS